MADFVSRMIYGQSLGSLGERTRLLLLYSPNLKQMAVGRILYTLLKTTLQRRFLLEMDLPYGNRRHMLETL